MKFRILASAVALALAGTAQADVTVEMVYQKSGESASTLMISGGKAWMNSSDKGAEQSWSIWDGAKFISGVPAQKIYMVLDKQTAAETGKQVNEAMKKVDKMFANLPPEMRKQMEAAMKKQGGGAPGSNPGGMAGGMIPKAVVTRTGKRDNVGGKSCEIVDWKMGEMAAMEFCVVGVNQLGIPASDIQTIKAMTAFVRSMTQQMGGGAIGAMPDPDELGGYPIRTVDKKTKRTQILKSVTQSADRSKFSIPAGYREQKIEIPKIG
jgi:hypothetical protein